MALWQGTIRSQALNMDIKVNVVLPYDYYDAEGKPRGKVDKVLYLLHGLKQNADAWIRYTSAEHYAGYTGYALVVPEVQRSWYRNLPGEMNYLTYIAEELPRVMNAMFRLPQGRENTFIGGLSMGGYGAMKCALAHPEQYAGAMCFSAAFYSLEAVQRRLMLGFTEEPLPQEDDIDKLIAAFPADAEKPKLYVACGTEDGHFHDNERCRDTLKAAGFDLTWECWPGGHDWTFWDAALVKGMQLMAKE